MKVYKSVLKEKEIDVLVCKQVSREEKFNYTVCVPVTKQEKRKVTVCTPVSKQVEYMCTVMVPTTVEKKVQCTTYQCVTEQIVEKVPVCKTVCVTYVDECGRCCTHQRERRDGIGANGPVALSKRTPVVTEKTVLCTICEPVQKAGKKIVCEIVRTEKEIDGQVCSYVRRAVASALAWCATP